MLSDRIGRKPIILLGYGLSVVSHLVAGFAQTPLELMASRMLIGTGTALSFTASTIYVTKTATVDKRSRYLALLQNTFSIAGIIGPTIGGLISTTLGVRAVFFTSAAISVLGVFLVWVMQGHEDTSPAEDASRSRLSSLDIIQDVRILTLSASCFLMFFLFSSVRGTMIPLYGADALNLSSVEIGLIFSFTSAITAIGLLFLTHRLETRFGRSRLLPLFLLLCAVSVFLVSVASNFLTLSTFIIPLGIGFSILQPTSFTMISNYADPESRGLTMGTS